eukprot:5733133-Alexandrium_andersonii.AAC.1
MPRRPVGPSPGFSHDRPCTTGRGARARRPGPSTPRARDHGRAWARYELSVCAVAHHLEVRTHAVQRA